MRSEVLRRDAAIDFVRGAGILMIAVDHLAYLAGKLAGAEFTNPFITWMRIGWSSAAEFFVFFSGYLTGVVYLKTFETHGSWMTWARAGQRAWHIYVVNLLTLCAVFALLHASVFADDQLLRVTDMALLFGTNASEHLASFLGLHFAPMFFEILGLYVVLLLIAPIILLTARVSAVLVLAISFGVWLAVQLQVAGPFTPQIAASNSFNPLAWQLVFVLGMLGGMYRVFDVLRQRFSRRSLLVTSGALLVLALALKVLERLAPSLPLLSSFNVPDSEKLNLGALQLLHFLVSVVFVMQIVPRSPEAQSRLAFKAVAFVGQRSLECFCLSTILAYTANGLLARNGSFDIGSMLLGGVAVVVLTCAAAPAFDWVEKRPWRASKRPPPTNESVERMPAQLPARNLP
jgi:hypothetical protein